MNRNPAAGAKRHLNDKRILNSASLEKNNPRGSVLAGFSSLIIVPWRDVFVCLNVHTDFARAWTIIRRYSYIVMLFRNDLRLAMIDDRSLVMEGAVLMHDCATVIVWNNDSFISESRNRDKQGRDRQG
jgi:hypothetical protein